MVLIMWLPILIIVLIVLFIKNSMSSNVSANVPIGMVTVPGSGSGVGDTFNGKSIVPGVTEFCTPTLGCDAFGIPVHIIAPVDPPPIAIQRPKLSCIPIAPIHCCHITVGPIKSCCAPLPLRCGARQIKPPVRIAPSSSGGSNIRIRGPIFFCQYIGGGGAMTCECCGGAKGFV